MSPWISILVARSDGATLRSVFTSIEERWPRPSVMGVLNVTPDSFSDGGLFVDPAEAVAHGLRLVEEGAALVDVGDEAWRRARRRRGRARARRAGARGHAWGSRLDRHREGGSRPARARTRSRARERRDGAPRRPGSGRGRRGWRRVPVPHAHAG